MKCSECNGTGIDDDRLTCYKCGGTGECDANEVDRFNAVDFIKVMEMVKNRRQMKSGLHLYLRKKRQSG